jgi:putative CocE/NonD family hydrolase
VPDDFTTTKITSPSSLPYRVTWGIKIPLRDGVELDATIIRPADERPAPVIFRLTPYTADRFAEGGAYFARAGYAFACVDVRGRGNSGGEFVLWRGEGRDGADVVNFLADQPWCDGQVAMWGGSYSGKLQWMIAGEAPPALKTIAPGCAGMVGMNIAMHNTNITFCRDHTWLVFMRGKTANEHAFTDIEYCRGLYEEASKGALPYRDFDTLAGMRSPVWREWLEHPTIDAFWDEASLAPERFGAIDLPTLSITGVYDSSATGTIAFRQLHLDAAGPDAAARSYLIIGPWDHFGVSEPKRWLGGIDFGEAALLDMKALHVAWYDHVLKGRARPDFLVDRVMYFLSGANEWRSAPSVAAATEHVDTLWLSSRGTDAGSIAVRGILAESAPPRATDSYVYDPSLPAHNEGFEGGVLVSPDFLTSDAMMRRIDGDGLIYDTAPLAAPADLVGQPRLELWLAMDVPDTDIRAALYEVTESGAVFFLAQDLMRARHRYSPRVSELVPRGIVERYRFERFNFVARRFAAGSVARLLIVPLGAGFHVMRNRNSEKPVAEQTAADNRVARVSVALGPGLSRIELPWGAGGDVYPKRP